MVLLYLLLRHKFEKSLEITSFQVVFENLSHKLKLWTIKHRKHAFIKSHSKQMEYFLQPENLLTTQKHSHAHNHEGSNRWSKSIAVCKICKSKYWKMRHYFVTWDRVVNTLAWGIFNCITPDGNKYIHYNQYNLIYLIICNREPLLHIEETNSKIN